MVLGATCQKTFAFRGDFEVASKNELKCALLGATSTCAFSGGSVDSIVGATKENRSFLVVTKQKGAVLEAMSCSYRGDKGEGCKW